MRSVNIVKKYNDLNGNYLGRYLIYIQLRTRYKNDHFRAKEHTFVFIKTAAESFKFI